MINIRNLVTGNLIIKIPEVKTRVKYTASSGLPDWEGDIVGQLTSSSIPNISDAEEVEIGSHVTSIGAYAFQEGYNLTSVTIPDSVTRIWDYAFENCWSLTSVNITDLAKWCEISFGGNYGNPLYYAHNLYLNGEKVTDLTIPDSVTNIGSYAFYGYSGLTSVTIPDSVTSIGGMAFSMCSSLTSVHITDLAKWCDISFGDSDANPLSCAHNLYLNGAKVTDLVIPDGVTNIGGSAFSGCSGLTSVTIPDSVTSIGRAAFGSCRGLTSVTIPNSVTSIGYRAFYGCSGFTSVTFSGKTKSTVQGMSNYNWSLKTGCVLHCTDGDIQL